ncbi:unnamed protein product [Brassica napus]|uniref:(rape) hypothetical protein n=1 Tax=Brassica napus TaxID=3708 RepID=A0A817AMC3_BRANA|nr:unnamed protein product [Brassica napus]
MWLLLVLVFQVPRRGTNFELDSLLKFNIRSAASPYYITLVACLPSSGLQQIFQVLVEEERLGILDLTCPISRPQGTESSRKESTPFLRPHSEPVFSTYQDRLDDWPSSIIPWPSSEIGFIDTKCFYMLNESELQCDWIFLYVELAICTSQRWFKAKDLSNFLEITFEDVYRIDDYVLCAFGLFFLSVYFKKIKTLSKTRYHHHFQVVVEEERLGILDLTCRHSRPQVTESSKKETPFLRPHRQRVSTSYKNRLLDWPSSEIAWPSSDIAFSDTKRFYVLNESELRCSDWISLYVELAICTSHRRIRARDLSKFELEIVQVAIESLDDKEPPSLKSKAVVIYITYKDLVKSLRIGEPCLCKAVVRRVVNETKGILSIQGDCWNEDETGSASEIPSKKYSKKGSRIFRRRLGVHKLWRLSNPRWHQTHKNRSLHSSRAN